MARFGSQPYSRWVRSLQFSTVKQFGWQTRQHWQMLWLYKLSICLLHSGKKVGLRCCSQLFIHQVDVFMSTRYLNGGRRHRPIAWDVSRHANAKVWELSH
eukprot:357806-Chlamydomonas_euryale.AAC.13